MLPRLQIPEKERNEEWCRSVVDAVRNMINAESFGERRAMEICYNFLNGYQDAKDYEYLTGKGDMRLPAKLRFLPIIRPYFDMLSSTAEARPLDAEVYAVDPDSLEQKGDEVTRDLIDRYLGRLAEERDRLTLLSQQTELARQQVMAMAQPQEGQQMDPRVQIRLASVDAAMKREMDAFLRPQRLVEDVATKWEREYEFGYRTSRERQMGKGLRYLMAKYDLRAKFVEGLRDLYAVDNCIYALDDIIEGRDPVLRKVNPMDLWHSAESGVRYLRDCSWLAERQFLTIEQVLDQFGDELSNEQVGRLEALAGLDGGLAQPVHRGDIAGSAGLGDSGDDCPPQYGGTTGVQGGVEVIRVSWFCSRKVFWKESKNPHDDSRPFLKLISDDEALARPRKGQKINYGYLTDRYQGIVIGGEAYVRMGLAPMQMRDTEDYGVAHHPYAGYAYNDTDNRPYSRIWAVKDVQVLYNLMYYQLELLLAMGGIKAFIMDKAQLPKDMSLDRFIHNMKQGIIWIDSSRPGASGRPTNFNQFPTVDLTFGNSVAQTLGVLDRLEVLAGQIIGVSRQRMGDVAPSDQVGTHQAAVQQSSLTTEILFHRWDRIKKQALDMLLHAMPHAWKNGKRGQYILGSYGQELLKISPGELGDARFETFFPDRSAQQQRLDGAMRLVTQSGLAGSLPLSQMISLFDTSGVHELEKLLKSYEDLAARKAREGEEAVRNHEQEMKQLDMQTQLQLKQTETGGERIKAQIEQMRLQLEAQLGQAEIAGRQQVAETAADARRYDADRDAEVEEAYLEEQKREHDIEMNLAQLELALGQKTQQNLSSTPQKKRSR